MKTLNVLIYQDNIVWQSPEANRKAIADKISDDDIDLVILPETFNTGFSNDLNKVSETMDGPTLTWMINLCKIKKIAICGSLVIRENDNFYNRFVFVSDGDMQYYNKRHLFSMGGEDHRFTKGTERKIIEWQGWKIRPIICYDLRFPTWCYNDLNYDLMICVANWPTPRIKHWDQLLLARAIENQAFVIGCNRTGKDGNDLTYSGHSAVIDPNGDYILSPTTYQRAVRLSLKIEDLMTLRQKLPFLRDHSKLEIG